MAKKFAYPFEYKEVVQAAAVENHVDPALVAGVILAESKFKHTAESDKGAVGLMQLMPNTAYWVGEQLNQSKLTDKDIREPMTNIKLGSWYLAYLLEEYDNNEILALAAYNAGRGHVDEWMQIYGWNTSFDDISAIPFSETKKYVEAVLKNRDRYKDLYDGDGE